MEQIEENNSEICNLTGEYKKIEPEPERREGLRERLKRMKALRKARKVLYEKQNDLKGHKQQSERGFAW